MNLLRMIPSITWKYFAKYFPFPKEWGYDNHLKVTETHHHSKSDQKV